MKIKEAFMKDVLNQLSQEKISFSKMVELINEEAKKDENTKSYYDYTRAC